MPATSKKTATNTRKAAKAATADKATQEEVTMDNATETAEAVTEATAATEAPKPTKRAAANASAEAWINAKVDPMFPCEFTVTINCDPDTVAETTFGPLDVATVRRFDRKEYLAGFFKEDGSVQWSPLGRTGNPHGSAKSAINALIKLYPGVKTGDCYFNAEEAEPEIAKAAGGNADKAEEKSFVDDPDADTQEALNDLQTALTEGGEQLTTAEGNTRDGWIKIGETLLSAQELFQANGEELSSRAWGAWVTRSFSGNARMTRVLESKNELAQAMQMARAPASVRETINVNTPSTFEQKVNEGVAFFGGMAGERMSAQELPNEAGDNYSDDSVYAVALAVYETLNAKVEADDKAIAEAVRKASKGDSPDPRAIAKAGKRDKAQLRAQRGQIVANWLLTGLEGAEGFAASKLGKAIVTAWLADRPATEAEKEEAAEEAAAKAKTAFADLSVDRAALHLYTILASHGDPEAVYAEIGNLLDNPPEDEGTEANA